MESEIIAALRLFQTAREITTQMCDAGDGYAELFYLCYPQVHISLIEVLASVNLCVSLSTLASLARPRPGSILVVILAV
eukprot:7739393-Pyramimonas_sp.AAC.1